MIQLVQSIFLDDSTEFFTCTSQSGWLREALMDVKKHAVCGEKFRIFKLMIWWWAVWNVMLLNVSRRRFPHFKIQFYFPLFHLVSLSLTLSDIPIGWLNKCLHFTKKGKKWADWRFIKYFFRCRRCFSPFFRTKTNERAEKSFQLHRC